MHLVAWFGDRGEPAYRARQVLSGVAAGRATGFDELTDLPKRLRADTGVVVSLLEHRRHARHRHRPEPDREGGPRAGRWPADRVGPHALSRARRLRAADDDLHLAARPAARSTARSARPARAGFGRHLTAAEIVDQVLWWRRARASVLDPEHHLNVVFMGMGEPLNNTDPVFAAVRLLNDPARLGIGARHITVSTSGVVPGHGPHGRRAAAGQHGDQPPRGARRAARRAGAHQPQVADRGRPRRRSPVRRPHAAPGQPRVRDDRWHQRRSRRGASGWRTSPAAGCAT